MSDLDRAPDVQDPSVQAFVRSVVPRGAAVELTTAEVVAPTAVTGDCFFNVFEQVALYGGKATYGWVLSTLPGVYLRADFWAVWNLGNQIVDVTPNRRSLDRFWFVPDPHRAWVGEPVQPVIEPVLRHRIAEELCNLLREEALLRSGLRVNSHIKGGKPRRATSAEARRLMAIGVQCISLTKQAVDAVGRLMPPAAEASPASPDRLN
jgi:hypothetical protein